MDDKDARLRRKQRLSEIIEVGAATDSISRLYDLINSLAIVINLIVSVIYTFEAPRTQYGSWLASIEAVTVAFFTVDYCLRLWTAQCLRPKLPPFQATLRYIFSFSGLVDLLSFLPYYLPVFFPSGTVAFRMFRVMRIFRLFRINAYYDSLNVITEVIASKRQQLMSSVFIIVVITFLGVGMVAIPTGIISAGFVDQYSRIKRISEYGHETDVHFIKVHLSQKDSWSTQTIQSLGLPSGLIVAAIQRGEQIVVPRGDVALCPGDTLVLGAESVGDNRHIDLKEVVLRRQNPWNGLRIRELDISRQTIIVMVKRRGGILIPNGDLILKEGDCVILYSQSYIPADNTIEI